MCFGPKLKLTKHLSVKKHWWTQILESLSFGTFVSTKTWLHQVSEGGFALVSLEILGTSFCNCVCFRGGGQKHQQDPLRSGFALQGEHSKAMTTCDRSERQKTNTSDHEKHIW